jgi:hypothetical protein
MTATAHPELEGLERYRFGWADSDAAGARANLAGCRPSRPVPLNAHAGLSARQLPAHPAARVLDDLRRVRGGAAAWATVSCMVPSFRFGGGWDLGPAGRSHASAGPLS